MNFKNIIKWLLLLPVVAYSQANLNLSDIKPGRFDQGKMWTFENAPVEYFQEAYGFTPTQEWLDDVRMSALRFASWCSASFISGQGLIMTNHHCSRSVVASVMKPGENFDTDGFYAETLADERRIPNLFVDQLVKIADITREVTGRTDISPDSALQVVVERYKASEEWAGLKIETRTFYSGGKYSLYGFKTYSDIRLVLYPELALGYFGGDPDNFTYPRFNLDVTLFRAYDETGNPLKPTHFFEFNPKGAVENEAVFVVGNPGSTGRYLTMSQLYYQRDVSAPAIIDYLKNRFDILMKASDEINDIYKKDSVTNMAFGMSNSHKAYTGRLEGLNDPYLMTKKEKKEAEVRANAKFEGADPWNLLEENMKQSKELYGDLLLLSPNPVKGKILQTIYKLGEYQKALQESKTEEVNKLASEITKTVKSMDVNLERALFGVLLDELKKHSRGKYITELIGNGSSYDQADNLLKESMLFTDPEKYFKQKISKMNSDKIQLYVNKIPARFKEVSSQMNILNAKNQALQSQIMNLQFQISGVSSPPDATFSLRIADGIVKGYSYNGTEAPYKTTFYGMYDRYYSYEGKFPWNLPERWKNPPAELLPQPFNFVSTADIIGGNSGSPIINKNAEVVGLVFDGNMESLPGYFIFDTTLNRTVSVHAGGIAAAVKYIYKAERLLKELNYQ